MIIKGDINGDGKITHIDLLLEQLAHLEVTELSQDAMVAADVNNNGEIDLVDLAMIKMHLLGGYVINEVIE